MLNSLLLPYLRYFPLDRGKGRLADSFDWKRVPTSFTHTNPRTGIRFGLDLNDRGDRLLYLYNSVERNTERHLRALLGKIPSDPVFFDCGANMGFYTLLIRTLSPRASVHSFEPLPYAFKRLERNIALNDFRGIHAIQAALSDREGKTTLFVGGQSGSASVIHVPGKENSFDVPMMTVDGYCRKNRIERIDIMKIDTEGSEPEVLRGAQQMIESNPGILLIVEMMDDRLTPGRYAAVDLFREIRDLGFDAFVPRGWPFPLQRIETYPPGYDDNLFFLRAGR